MSITGSVFTYRAGSLTGTMPLPHVVRKHFVIFWKVLYLYRDQAKVIRSNIGLCLREFRKAKPKGILEGGVTTVTTHHNCPAIVHLNYTKRSLKLSMGLSSLASLYPPRARS